MEVEKKNCMEGKYRKILDQMRGLCSKREYCTSDIRNKIMNRLKKCADDDDFANLWKTCNEMIDLLVHDGYVNDRRYAQAFVRDKSSIDGWGRMKIVKMLSDKNIDKDIIDSSMECADRDKSEKKMRRLLEVKADSLFRNQTADGGQHELTKLRAKLLRFAVGRGYTFDEVSVVVDEIICIKSDTELCR